MKTLFECNKDYTDGQLVFCDLKNFYEGGEVTLILSGKEITRKVYDSKDGLYVNFKNHKLFYENFN